MSSTDNHNMWCNEFRPGYFGRTRDQKISDLNAKFGHGNWRLAWVVSSPIAEGHVCGGVCAPDGTETVFDNGEAYHRISAGFEDACQIFYESSYFRYFVDRKSDVDDICSYGECYDNAITNIQSGLDYTKQESFSTHIQDIAIRNVLARLGRKFGGPPDRLLQIRSKDSVGFRFGPGNVPFYDPDLISQPSLCPKWANAGSVESFWQSNKWVQSCTTGSL